MQMTQDSSNIFMLNLLQILNYIISLSWIPNSYWSDWKKTNTKIKEEYTRKSQFNEDLSIPSSPHFDFPSFLLIAASLPTTCAECNSQPALN